tara:strand:- start:709 stop:1002 length:294 start_codon:yes stop_codon:yes gene_type:complete
MPDGLLKYWPILVAIVSALGATVHASYTAGKITEQTASQTHDIRERMDKHVERPGHEQTAIRLERIEVQQMNIAEDVGRIQKQLDQIGDDVREAMKR